jgi:2-polyprenyl-6-methoxyphenol hydroxylase-like FAD-dependent oxidoreductase
MTTPSYPSGGTATDPDYDVLIVGAGPTGLLLAGDLAAAGIKVAVLERRQSESNLTRAFAVHARTLEVLQMRGLAQALVDTGQRVPRLRLFGRVDVPLTQLRSAYNYVLVTPQYETEKLLLQRAHDHGALIEKNQTVTAVDQGDELVTATVVRDTHEETVTARWLVAADGARSSVRSPLVLTSPVAPSCGR